MVSSFASSELDAPDCQGLVRLAAAPQSNQIVRRYNFNVEWYVRNRTMTACKSLRLKRGQSDFKKRQRYRKRPVPQMDQFRQYVKEAVLAATAAQTYEEKAKPVGLAEIWTPAAMNLRAPLSPVKRPPRVYLVYRLLMCD
jgi:hypothetical protein